MNSDIPSPGYGVSRAYLDRTHPYDLNVLNATTPGCCPLMHALRFDSAYQRGNATFFRGTVPVDYYKYPCCSEDGAYRGTPYNSTLPLRSYNASHGGRRRSLGGLYERHRGQLLLLLGDSVAARPHTWPTPTPCTFHSVHC